METSDPVFARTRHTYDSYGDFWRLVAAAGSCTDSEAKIE